MRGISCSDCRAIPRIARRRSRPVIAYGMVETTRDAFTITVREEVAAQINVEIVSRRGEEIPDHFEEKTTLDLLHVGTRPSVARER